MLNLSPHSHLGRVVSALSPDTSLTAKQIFDRAFTPSDNLDVCRDAISTARAGLYIEKEWTPRQPNRFRLTPKGEDIKRALGFG